ncbi:MAG: hypothetical protein APR54_12755 [Candidatus Cloacimonas sp. SDB]|nr:MAG: hypothetical protein APR54_12755 [Candidatus Cloacimonas sp. SDB]
MFLPLIFSYAEIHYHLKKIYPLYFKKFPEIIADVPSRFIYSKFKYLPILVLIKDSHIYPIKLKKIVVRIKNSFISLEKSSEFDQIIDSPFFSTIIKLEDETEEFNQDGYVNIDVIIHFSKNNKDFSCINDNYDLPYKPFICYFSSEPLPYPKNWYAGDTHYHSSYTEDQVEFGADIPATVEMARVMGLDWFFVTDHSYDLDDTITDYTVNDPKLPKWKKFLKEIEELKSDEIKVIPGVEVSIGNQRNRNVHLLAVNHDKFIKGSGDSAEKWFSNKPEEHIRNIAKLQNNRNLFIAAHPWEKVPFLQKITLRRDNWHEQDFAEGGINYLQIINSNDKSALDESKKKWSDLLLKGRKIFIVAGNDAHGNFNIMRQIKLPFVKLFSNRKQIFGKYHTVFNYTDNDPIKGLKKGRIIVSNGPFLDLNLSASGKTFAIGSTVTRGNYTLEFTASSGKEFGRINAISLFYGNYKLDSERLIKDPQNYSEIELKIPGYIRMELLTEFDGVVLTNPIWIEN